MSEHMFPQPPSHSGYVRGCRCEGCVDARRVYNRLFMRKARREKRYEPKPRGATKPKLVRGWPL